MDCDSPGVSPSCFAHLAFILIQLQYLCPFSRPGCRLIELDPAVILLSSYPHESHHLIRSSTISQVSSLVIPPMPVLSGYRMMTTSKSDSSIFASHGSSTDLSESLPCISRKQQKERATALVIFLTSTIMTRKIGRRVYSFRFRMASRTLISFSSPMLNRLYMPGLLYPNFSATSSGGSFSQYLATII